ncbi:MAG: hypothetical protein QGG26_17460, partial [Candidatus Undinarchaeales archaeon]|nr:hypothetical protein [Candidatus Undinarchaeales archaeon]
MDLPLSTRRDTMVADRRTGGRMEVLTLILLLVLATGANGDVKVTVTTELGTALQGATVEVNCDGSYDQLTGDPTTDGSGIVQAQPTGTSNCGSGGRIDLRVTKDGYVLMEIISDGSNRWYNDDVNAFTVSSIQFAYKVTAITLEGPGTSILTSLSSLSAGDDTGRDTCTRSGSTWYCPVTLTNSNGALVARPVLDGYVEESFTLSGASTRSAHTDAQRSGTVSGVKYAYKITSVAAEGPGTDLTGSLSSLSVGDASGTDGCTLYSGTWYCPTTLTHSDQTIIASPGKDGYVQESYTVTGGTTRGSHTSSQVTGTVSGV